MLPFFQQFAASPVDGYAPPADIVGPDEADPKARFDLECAPEEWRPITPSAHGWSPDEWSERPVRFVDGRDGGDVVVSVLAPYGYRIPVRVGQVGSIALEVRGRTLRRLTQEVDTVVAFVADPFPWVEVEGLAPALHAAEFRLLTAPPIGGTPSFDFERMRKSGQNRTMAEMEALEEAVVTQVLADGGRAPLLVDGRLERVSRGFDPTADPVYGFIKTHHHRYLHDTGLRTLYSLERGQRTPLFAIAQANLDVVSWYLRLSGGAGPTPNYGVVRVEVALPWFSRRSDGSAFADRLSLSLLRARCCQSAYSRAAVSLEPVVRAEQTLGASFRDRRSLRASFLRLTGR